MNKKGFTLVELLVVVAILGVLAAVGIVSFDGFLGSAKENATKSNHNKIVTFIEVTINKCLLGLEENVILKNQNGQNESMSCYNNNDNNPVASSTWAGRFRNHFSSNNFNNPYNTKKSAIISNQEWAQLNSNNPSERVGYNFISHSDNFVQVYTIFKNPNINHSGALSDDICAKYKSDTTGEENCY